MKTGNKPIVAKQVLAFLQSKYTTLKNSKTQLSREGRKFKNETSEKEVSALSQTLASNKNYVLECTFFLS